MDKNLLLLLLIINLTITGTSQGVFESSLGANRESGSSGATIGGYTRGTAFIGLIPDNDPLLRSLYSETSVKLKAKAGQRGLAFSDIRFWTGTEFGANLTHIDIREAYADLLLGKLQFRIGKQISVWGRADGFNPTDNLTPKNYFVRSPDVDDMRSGNFLVRAQYRPFRFLQIEADVIPWYAPSVYRFDLVEMPDFVTIEPVTHPGFAWDESTLALKADLFLSSFEGSVSWFNGYDPLPALRPGQMPVPPFTTFAVQLLQNPFRQQIFGADFAATLFKTGIRGEVAYKTPEQGEVPDPFIPNSEFQWAASIDRGFGVFRIIAGYSGKWVEDFIPADPPQPFDPSILADPSVWPLLEGLLAGQLSYYNRILFDQTYESSHTVLLRPSLRLFHETLDLEISGIWNITTEEYMVYPKVTYQFGDGIQGAIGYQYYDGPDFTRFNWIKELFNGPFFEVKISF